MKVVKFVRSEENGGFRGFYFELCDRLADYIVTGQNTRMKKCDAKEGK